MNEKPAVHPDASVGDTLLTATQDVLGEARAALDDPARTDAVAVHDYRKAMKRWRALLRLLAPFVGDDGQRLRDEARDLARELAGARDAQSALDALADLGEDDGALTPGSGA
ncbi:MAG TPA: CHAD domain-containing protein, partial [Xanthobacteraceae bacterium]|nr:CHAD domain-containing protein [Xanthobacteraceae bacterium]